MANYTVTPTAQTLEDIMGTDFDDSKSYNIHVNQCAPGVLQVIPATKTGAEIDPYDGSRGLEYPAFSDLSNIADADEIYFKSSSNSSIDIYVEEVSA